MKNIERAKEFQKKLYASIGKEWKESYFHDLWYSGPYSNEWKKWQELGLLKDANCLVCGEDDQKLWSSVTFRATGLSLPICKDCLKKRQDKDTAIDKDAEARCRAKGTTLKRVTKNAYKETVDTSKTVELPQDEVAKLKEVLKMEGSSAYGTLIAATSHPAAIYRARIVSGTQALQRRLNFLIILNRVMPVASVVVIFFGQWILTPVLLAIWYFVTNPMQTEINWELGARLMLLDSKFESGELDMEDYYPKMKNPEMSDVLGKLKKDGMI